MTCPLKETFFAPYTVNHSLGIYIMRTRGLACKNRSDRTHVSSMVQQS